jgi:DnaA family protein
MGWGPVYHLRPLDEKAKLRALQERASARGLELSDEAASYLLQHARRDMRSLLGVLDRLDRASLAAHRRLTVPFIRQVLQGGLD